MSKNTRLVYSTDPKENRSCPKCKELIAECRCTPEGTVKSFNFVAVLRLEKSGRGGKVVTVIDQLPKQEIFLKDLAAELKKKCGAGGTYIMDRKEGVIEIQGDKRDTIRDLLGKKGFKTKG
jgi:translation initiation factor 1